MADTVSDGKYFVDCFADLGRAAQSLDGSVVDQTCRRLPVRIARTGADDRDRQGTFT